MGERTRFGRVVALTQTRVFTIAFTTAALLTSLALSDDKPAPKTTGEKNAKPPAVVCLHTEFLPWRFEDQIKFRLMRELGRQALLIAARDELGLATRDETLGEVFPEETLQAKRDLFVIVRSQYNGTVQFQLWPASNPDKPNPSVKESERDPNAIINQITKLDPLIHSGLCDMLHKQGFDGKAAPPNDKNLPSDAVEGQLLEMNFVSQFAAVRAAHAAIAEKGQSRGWLNVLARGYANLALMTGHHWKSDSEAFAARALLYAERLVTLAGDDSLAHATRAYVRAIVGLHGAALEEVNRVNELRKQHPDQKELPSWFEVVEPYCSFEREPLHALGDRRPSLRQVAQRLSFEQIHAFGDDRWLFDSAKESLSVCPEEYSIYAALTQASGSLLSVVRTGAYYGPAALAHFLPQRIAKLDGAPESVQAAAKGVTEKAKKEAKSGDAQPKDEGKSPDAPAESAGEYASGTIPIVEALRAATRSGEDHGEPSLSALGELIFEEQFVQAANYLKVAMNATESSHDDEVKSMAHAIKGHRFAPYIEGYRADALGDTHTYYSLIGDMRILDARGNMQPMIARIWPLEQQTGNKRCSEAAWYASNDQNLTFNGLLEAYNAFNYAFWPQQSADDRKRWADNFHVISPHSPQALRIAIRIVEKPTIEELTQWESQAGEDPHAYRQLGERFAALERYDDAIRVYERSVSLSPTMEAYVGLANSYRAAGQDDKWQPTLERFFKVESLGLEHASVHSLIAYELIDKGKWEEAEPHATAAAETWSAWGLEVASRVNEGLGRWEESEKWIREQANAYPTTSADEWYFWCRRTGRGNVDQARQLMPAYFKQEWIKTNLDGLAKLFTFHVAENDLRGALDDAKNFVSLAEAQHESNDMEYYQLHLAFVARELKETAATTAAIKEIRELTEESRKKHPNLSAFYVAICDILDGKTIADDARADIVAKMEQQPKETRCNCYYFLGKAYDLTGNKELADQYWKQCVTRGPFARYNCVLAGKYLSDRNKTSRP
jgi:tetratricopeptide (TPR) repeat protein